MLLFYPSVDFVLQFAKLPVTPGKERLTNSPEVRHNFRVQVLFFLTEVFSKTVVFPYPGIESFHLLPGLHQGILIILRLNLLRRLFNFSKELL